VDSEQGTVDSQQWRRRGPKERTLLARGDGFPVLLFFEWGPEGGKKQKKDVSVKKPFRFFMIAAIVRAKYEKLKGLSSEIR
jgi:hypothetical protein